jgi:hypothetical protein
VTEAGRETISGRDNRCWCGRPPALSAVVVARPPTGSERHWCPEHGWSSRPLWAAATGADPAELDEDVWLRWEDLATATRTTAVVSALLPVPVLVVDSLVRAVWSNPTWTDATGLSREATRGAGWRAALELDGPITLTEAVLEGKDQRVRLRSATGVGREVVLSCAPLVDADGERLGHLVTISNPPARGGALDAIDPDALEHAATAHRQLVGRAEDALTRSHIGQHDGTVAMLLVQVELAERPESKELLPVTDPDALRSLEDEIRARCDHGEAVVDEGGGVFAVVADGIASYGRAMDLANELAHGLGRSARGRARKGSVRVSAGLAFAHLPDETAERLVSNAAQALELARATGGGHVEVVIGSGPGSSDAWDPP